MTSEHPDWKAQMKPHFVDVLEEKEVVAAAAGHSHTVVCTSAGELFTWGFANHGRLGHGALDYEDYDKEYYDDREEEDAEPTHCLHTPRQVQAMVTRHVVAVSAGDNHTAVCTGDGELWTFGRGGHGQLGLGPMCTSSQMLPQRVNALEDSHVVSASCGYTHTLALTDAGHVYAFGHGRYGELGHGAVNDIWMPSRVDGLAAVVGISAGMMHSAAWTAKGAVWTWGHGEYGQLGHGGQDNEHVPRLVEALTAKNVIGVSVGTQHTVAWTEEGELLSFGSDFYGQLGTGGSDMDADAEGAPCLLLPRLVQALEGHKVVCAASAFHTIVGTDNGDIFTFGNGESGRLGNGEDGEDDQFLPVQIALPW